MRKSEMYDEFDRRLRAAALMGVLNVLFVVYIYRKLEDNISGNFRYQSERYYKHNEILYHPGVRELLEKAMADWADRVESEPPKVDVPQRMRGYSSDF